MQSVDWTIDGLLEETQKLLKSYVKDVTKAYENELEGILLYGSAVRGEFLPGRSNLNLLLVMSSYDLSVLKKYDSIHNRWSKEQVVVPLFLTAADLQSSSLASLSSTKISTNAIDCCGDKIPLSVSRSMPVT